MRNSRFKDWAGHQQGRWIISTFAGADAWGNALWKATCQCGIKKIISASSLRQGSQSCGCLAAERVRTHGATGTTTYKTWCQIFRRCYEKSHIDYPRYGGLGIKVCKRWERFENFLADMGERPQGLQIDRINNDRGYSPSNCRWVTLIEQANNKRNNHRVTWRGTTMTIAEWARNLGFERKVISDRIVRYRWSVARALSTPLNAVKLKAWVTRRSA